MRDDRIYQHPGRYWESEKDQRILCNLCPRHCRMALGQRGFCYIRQNINGEMMLTSYGRSSGFCVDPIEKKPLNHFYPGHSVFSFGTAGCNLGCKFCQNWDISKARDMDRLADFASPERIATTAHQLGCRAVAFTYNDPVIFLEYAVDTAAACREQGLATIAVSAGYITDQARPEFYRALDAANIDLKAFSERFYRKLTSSHLQPVLETLQYIVKETNVWLEITTLLIPGENDSDSELHAMAEWIAEHLGPDVPLHFSAFHPDYKLVDHQATPHKTLLRARQIALQKGLHFVYVGNVHDRSASSTYCPNCQKLLIERDWYQLGTYALDAQGRCNQCQTPIPGRWAATKANWGRKRLPIHLSE